MRLGARNEALSRWLLVLGGLLVLATTIVGFLNSTVVNGAHFAEIVNKIRQDPAVAEQVGNEVARAAVDAQPDLVAVQPALAAGAAALAGSPVLDPVLTPAVRSFHTALTQEGATSAVLTLADLGATVTTALQTFAPNVAEALPPDLNVTLAQVGGQQGLAAQIMPFISAIATLAWVVPLITLAVVAAAVLLAPRRRVAFVRLGWMLVIVSGLLALIVLGMYVASLVVDDQTLPGAVTSAALREFSYPLGVRFLATAVLGGLIVASAGALLPQIDVSRRVREALDRVLHRPQSQGWQAVRALAIVGLGALVLLNPTRTAQAVAVVIGLALFFLGLTELDAVAERMRENERRADEAARPAGALAEADAAASPRGRGRIRWLVPLIAGLGAAVILAALIVPQHLPQDEELQPVADESGCNGFVSLCDKPLDQVVIAASHNSMSVADGTWFLAEQPKDMVSSLDDGIRGLLVDTWYGMPSSTGRAITAERSVAGAEAALTETYGADIVASVRRTIDRIRVGEPTGPEQPFFCHTVCELGGTAMEPEMVRLNGWLDAHPRNVLVLFIQDTVTPADTAGVLERAGLADRAYVHPEGAAWPTLGQMIADGKNLLVLMENEGGGTQYPYLHQGFDLVQDTPYTFQTAADFTCEANRGHPDSPLLMMNHWLASFARLVSNAEAVNTREVLMDRVDECVKERGRVPNLIAVNWYDHGDLFAVVNELNGIS